MSKKKKVLICTPSHDGKVQVGYSMGSLDLIRKENKNFEFDWFFTEYSSDIMKARNEMLWYFYYGTTHDYILFIDSDQGFNAETVNELLLHAENFEISGAPVPLKRIYDSRLIEWVGAELQDDDNETLNVKDILPATYDYNHSQDGHNISLDRFVYTEKLGTGFMLIPRFVVDVMNEYYDENTTEYSPPVYTDKNMKRKCYSFFSHLVHKGKMLCEDYSFCIRAKECGIPLKVDTYLNVDHYGTFKWEGKMGAKKRHQKVRKKIIEKYTEK